MARRSQDIYIEWRGGTCRVKWWTGEYHESGRKRFESEGGFTDEDEAFQCGQDKLYEIRHGTHVSRRDSATTMTQWLDDWIATLDHAPTTERQYRSIVKTHIRPYFDARKMAVRDVDVLAYRAFKKRVNQTVKAANTRRNIMTVLGMILDDAVPRLIQTSPVERTGRRGRHKKKPRERKRDMLIQDVEQLALNARTLMGLSGYVFVWTMATTGMRPGELYGLTREYCCPAWPKADPRPDKNEDDRYAADLERYGPGEDVMPAIRVERQVQYVDSELMFLPPKYDSKRTLVVPPFLADLLEELLDSHDEDWVFVSKQGKCLAPANFDYAYWHAITGGAGCKRDLWAVRAMKKAGAPAVEAFDGKRLYLLRHGHKAWLDEDGHSRFAVESRMGHEVPGVEGTYSSVTVAMERAIMKSLQARWESFRGAGA